MFCRSCMLSGNEKGIVLNMVLWFIMAMGLLGSTAAFVATTNTQISGNVKASVKTFYASEAGMAEARERLSGSAANQIVDADPNDSNWGVYIGNAGQATAHGYDANVHTLITSVQNPCNNPLDYTVKIEHIKDVGNQVLFWGDDNNDGIKTRNPTVGINIYKITSFAAQGGAQKTLIIEAMPFENVPSPGALYVEAPSTFAGISLSTNINGFDQCGSSDVPGLATPLPDNPSSVALTGNTTIIGSLPIEYSTTPDLDIAAMVQSWKETAHFMYSVSSASHTSADTPGPGDGWGSPTLGATLGDPSSCSDPMSVVYYDTHGTYIQLSDGVAGCGLLLVDGDLYIDGDFAWYGAILATGDVTYMGGGNKQVTGAILSGGEMNDVTTTGGHTNVTYCSNAVDFSANLPLLVLNWQDPL